MEFKPEKQYIAKLLGEEGQKFIIPEYQRPYRWTKNECETLWDDVVGVFGNGENMSEYFLGSIVAFESKKSELEIIDGQQRITTLTLLFRAFYECFSYDSAKEKLGYLEGFGKCVWEHDLDKGLDFENCHLSSKVIADRDEKILKKILSEEFTIADIKGNNSNYAKNYIFFYEKLEEFKLKDTLLWEKFCKMFLTKRLFILLVICDSQESAMTIFNTLNSRGLPLSNADILKGYIYKKVKNKEKFANDWKDIETKIEESENVKDLDFLFLQYMHIIRAENEDTNTATQGILPFFTKTDKKEYYGALQDWLYKPETMPFISNLADFWINPKEYLSDKSSRYIGILNLFQNDTWKFFVSYLVWRNKNYFNNDTFNKNKFSKEFDKFLPELIKYITLPFLNNNATTGVVKEIVFKMNVSLYKKENFIIGHSMPKQKVFFEIINSFDTRKIKYILFLYAYIYGEFEVDINASDLEVEHILPKEWQSANFDDWDEENHKKYVEKIGNKILLDKKSNIKCSNNFFAKKQEIYKKIYDKGYNLKEVYDLGTKKHTILKQKGENKRSIWEKQDINKRGNEIYEKLSYFLSNNN
ncbi:DUF262 domain-containing protein [Brachyspira sp.]|uniref:DUF262 domain-containing protein n=1 Tax=Brachyspira sp. TaxID=1977261 RepID=UPI003D7D7C90